MKILFLCTGNSGRSPMAEIYFRHLCQQNNIKEVYCHSAGIKVGEHYEVAPEAKEVMASLGLSLENHMPRQINETIVLESDYIIAMDSSQIDFVKKHYPNFPKQNLRLVLSFLGTTEEIDDLEEGDLEIFQECFLTLMPALANLADRIKRST